MSVKKIAFFLPHFDVGGVERVVLNLLTHLNRDLFEPSLIVSSYRGALFDLLPDDVAVTSFDGRSMRHSLFELRMHILNHDIDVVYGGTNVANLTLAFACLTLPKKPVLIISEHTPPSLFLDNAKWKPLRKLAMKILYPVADCLVTPLEQVSQELQEIFGKKLSRVVELPNPLIDESLLSIQPKTEYVSGAPLKLASAGRLVHLKGFDILLKALRILLDQGVDAELLILGEGPERNRLERQIKDLDLVARVRLAGNVANPMKEFQGASVFVLSSRREGFGNVIVEAMASGIPVVASDCPVGPRVILRDGMDGLLVAPDSPEALAVGIAELAAHPEHMQKFSEAGIKRAADFTVGKALKEFESLVLELSKRRNRAVP